MYYERDKERGLPKWLVKAKEDGAKEYWADPEGFWQRIKDVRTKFLREHKPNNR